MAYRRDRTIRELYEERFSDRSAPYQRVVSLVDRRTGFNRPEDDYDRVNDYDLQRYGGGPRGYHGDDQRGYHGDSGNFGNERRNVPPYRRDEPYPYYRGPREDPQVNRQVEIRNRGRVASQPSVRGQRLPPPRSMSSALPNGEDDTLMQAIMNLDRGDDREGVRRKAPFPSMRERSPIKRDIPPFPHSRSGSSVSSRSYSPDRGRSYPYPNQTKKRYEEPYGPSRESDKEKTPSYMLSGSRDGSPHSSVSASKEEIPAFGGEQDEVPVVKDDAVKSSDEVQDPRAQAIMAKALEIEKLYRQDCETFGMVVKMLISKEPSLEKLLQTPLRENLIELRDRCLDDLRQFITEVDETQKS
ncbi:periphilin-1 [Chanos chanos]|uniref:Periphilin-1 n=1 Tax=Chanos chanos TaxID=29144 RepID=A0A6J2VJ92_CHACN|nr:periphilin-1-like [Chanos chanos]